MRFVQAWEQVAVAAAAVVLLSSCPQNNGRSTGKGGYNVETIEANPNSSELLERSYGYLMRGDRDLTRLAPNYAKLRPFAPDTSIVVETRSEVEGIEAPPADYNEYLHIRLNRPMSVRVVVADSTGNGLIVYELHDLPTGAYTVGSKGWPVPQIELTRDLTWVYVYVVGDKRFRYRTRFRLDDKRHFVPLTASPQAG